MANPEPIKFSRLRLEGWRQFESVDIELHPALTVITGANGAGKSTLLNIFSQHFGYQRPYLATPLRDKSGGYSYLIGIFTRLRKFFESAPANVLQVGEISYTNGTKSVVNVPQEGSIQYRLSVDSQQTVQGFHIPSHRVQPTYQQVANIPTQLMLPEHAYNQFNSEMSTIFQGGHTGYSPTYRIKEALLSMAAFGPGNKYMQQNEVVVKAFDGYVDVLRKVLPAEIGFLNLSIRSPDVVVVTRSGDFLIDAASGGLMALVDLAWHIYMFSLRVPEFVVTIDEPENHLHPSMQRSLMGNLIKTFPEVQFIVATHSPFIVSALKEARVYVLKYEDRAEQLQAQGVASPHTRYVSSVRLDTVNRAGTASQILRDVLGLPTTYPEWVSDGVSDIVSRYRGKEFNDAMLASLRTELQQMGYSDLFPDVVSTLVKP